MNITADILAMLSPAQIAALPAHTVVTPAIAAPIALDEAACPNAGSAYGHAHHECGDDALEGAIAQELAAADEARDLAADALPVLTRSAWKRLRTTRKGAVKAKFAGLTREQAFDAGLCEGFRMPTGDMKRHLAAQA